MFFGHPTFGRSAHPPEIFRERSPKLSRAHHHRALPPPPCIHSSSDQLGHGSHARRQGASAGESCTEGHFLFRRGRSHRRVGHAVHPPYHGAGGEGWPGEDGSQRAHDAHVLRGRGLRQVQGGWWLTFPLLLLRGRGDHIASPYRPVRPKPRDTVGRQR